jgi:hypothetical protein
MKYFILTFLFISSAWAISWKAEGQAQLLELYTSEGCSSCPRADAYLSTLVHDPNLWKTFVPLSFHVNYWDNLGWKDPFATEGTTQRQRDIATTLKSSNIYTPQFVLQGEDTRGSFDHKMSPIKLSAAWDGKELTWMTSPELKDGTIKYAWVSMDVNSDVRRGENSGKNLHHDFVVSDLGKGAPVSTKKMDLTRPLSSPAPLKVLVIWIEREGKPVVAVANWL